MIILGPSTTLSAIAGTATAVTCSIFGDTVSGSPPIDAFGMLYQGQLSNAAATLLFVSPGTQRLIKSILLSNTSGSSVSGIKFFSNGNAAANQLVTITIPANGSATWTDGKGWTVYDSTGVPVSGSVVLPSIANNKVLANISGALAPPVGTDLTALIDSAISAVQGGILYRSASAWVALAAGTAGQFLQTKGAGANPLWSNVQPIGFAYVSNPGTVVVSTTPNNVVDTRAVPAATLAANQILECTLRAFLTGTNNTKSLLVGIDADLSNALTAVFAAGQVGIVTFIAQFIVNAASPHLLTSRADFQQQFAGGGVKRGSVTVNLATTAINLLTEAWVSSASDSITIDSVSWTLKGNGL